MMATSSRLGFTLLWLMLFTPSQAFPGGSEKISKAAVFFSQRHFRWYSNVSRNPGWPTRTWREPVTCQETKFTFFCTFSFSNPRTHLVILVSFRRLHTLLPVLVDLERGEKCFSPPDPPYPCPCGGSRCCCSEQRRGSRWG